MWGCRLPWDEAQNAIGVDFRPPPESVALPPLPEPATVGTTLLAAGKPILRIAHPLAHEILPPELHVPLPQRDYCWVWVAYEHGEAKAVVYASDFHGIVMLSALRAMPGVRPVVILRLLRALARTCHWRGYHQFMTFLSTETPAELKLLRIVQKFSHASFAPAAGAWAVADIPRKGGWL